MFGNVIVYAVVILFYNIAAMIVRQVSNAAERGFAS